MCCTDKELHILHGSQREKEKENSLGSKCCHVEALDGGGKDLSPKFWAKREMGPHPLFFCILNGPQPTLFDVGFLSYENAF